MRKSSLVLLFLLTVSGPALQARQTTTPPTQNTEPTSGKPQIGKFGFDEAGMDRSVDPGNDFATYSGGTWIKNAVIPSDQSSYGMFNVLQDKSLADTRAILDDAQKTPGDKIGDFYATFMDQSAIEAKGMAPIKPWLAAIDTAADKSALAVEMAKLARVGIGNLFGFGVEQDAKAPDQYIVGFGQAGLGLPARDYYLDDNPKLAAIRTAYRGYLARMLTLAGEPDAEARAAQVLAFEKALAAVHWTRTESRDADKTYNKWSAADFAAKAPGFPWSQFNAAAGIADQQSYIVAQPSAMTGEAKLFADTPLAVLKDYMALKVLRSYASYLPKRFDDANFAFYGTTLSGIPEQCARWKRGVAVVSGAMGEAVGKQYVGALFPARGQSGGG